MELGLKGRVAIVAAASQGIGRACAMSLAREGTSVAICARTPKTLQQTAAEIRDRTGAEVLAMPADVSDLHQIQALVRATLDRFGRVDIAVTNAGGPPGGPAIEATEEQWAYALGLNLLSVIRLSREVVPSMRRQRWGRIINIVSTSVKEPFNNLVLSNVTRAGVVAFAKTLSNELGPDNILINNVCPGSIWTARSQQASQRHADRLGISLEEAVSLFNQTVPLRRQGQPEELADLVTFLASEPAAYITGTTIQVDGGLVRSLM
ncbi:MAG: SDR family oxidoreductase [Ardenticatenaceae bacterium]|nr:SDR family oxidoreductase [Ardenticatenaceae bacterium]